MLDAKILTAMNKFFNVLLKGILVLSFAGIIFIVGVVIVKNHSISYEAYDYITSKIEENDFPRLKNSIDVNVKVAYGLADDVKDPYAKFLGVAVTNLEEGISHFLDYLALEPDLTKGEQDTLISKYSPYFEGFTKLKNIYDSYLEIYKRATEATDDDINKNAKIADVQTYEIALIEDYIHLYEDGSDFFKTLVDISSAYTLGSDGQFVYRDECYMLEVGMSDYIIRQVFFDSTGKLLQTRGNIENLPLKLAYDKFCSEYQHNVPSSTLSDESFKNFVETLNKIDVYEFAGNYENFLSGVKQNLKYMVERAHDFFTAI